MRIERKTGSNTGVIYTGWDVIAGATGILLLISVVLVLWLSFYSLFVLCYCIAFGC